MYNLYIVQKRTDRYVYHLHSHFPPLHSALPAVQRRRSSIAVAGACALATGAMLANVAFVGLGSVFDYPDILLKPTDDLLDVFQANRTAVMTWFALLAFGAALLGPGAVWLSKLGRSTAARLSAYAGVAAAAVQVVGLSRWFVLVPGLADTATDPATTTAQRMQAIDRFELAHNVLGKVVGETFGYLLTSAWTVLVIVGIGQLAGGRVWRTIGLVSAGMIAVGVLTPLDVPGSDTANFIGYVLWTTWVLALAVRLIRTRRSPAADTATATHDEAIA